MSDINNLRDKIDKITFDILRLFKERNDIAKEIGNLKNNLKMNITNEERENQLRVKVLSLCKEIGLEEKMAMNMLNLLLNESVKIQSSEKQTHLTIFLKAKKMEKEGKKIIHMEVGEPDFLPPQIVNNALSEIYHKGYTKYGDSKGMIEFRDALSKYILKKFGANTSSQNILISPGARFSVFLAISSLLSPGDEIIVIEPAWPAYRDNALNSGVKVRTVHTTLENKWEPKIEDIENTINKNTKMIVLNYPNNPTGKILPASLQDKIIELAIKNDLYVLSDEIYSEYANKPWKSVLTYGYPKSIITQSFSKSHAMTGFRIGYAISSPEIIEKMSKLQALALTNVSEPIQYVAMRALEADTSDNAKIIRNRLKSIIEKAKTMGLDFVEPDGAMYLFAKIRQENFDSIEFTSKLLDAGVAIAPGDGFGNYNGFVRISACQPEDTLNQGMQIIEERLKNK
ncbi:Aminotransferase class I and II [Nitrosotalea sinensis]|uniref:Aminotransferase n=1 Tax=Nitrosotalea sinensis TaxID=1499975 RepID=A0A2H1EIX1_9ARCH|nr:aminotransferase class I/II-fold pyridoxal phosphate-dependent enzyme [Candidatus Nitrosotalea sinensis]SHO47924.1 Aminotransferase class I and II [Candidatus Nitrosotalea sinensis]